MPGCGQPANTSRTSGNPSTGSPASSTSDPEWAIAVAFLSGPGHRDFAIQRVQKVARDIGRSDLRVRSRDQGSVIVAGRYTGPGDPAALAEIKRIKAIEIDGDRPYERAYLTPPVENRVAATTLDELDLRGAKARFGDEQAVYTLQYATFDEGNAAQYRARAIEEARRRRSEGELAFFFHGRSNSTVTLGVFGVDALDANARFSPEVDALQRRFTFLMKNGERIPLSEGTFWPTRLVRVP